MSCSVLFTRGWADLRGSGRYALSFPLSSPMYSTSHTLAPRHPAYYLNFNPSCCRQRNDGRNVLARDISGGISSPCGSGVSVSGSGVWLLAPCALVHSSKHHERRLSLFCHFRSSAGVSVWMGGSEHGVNSMDYRFARIVGFCRARHAYLFYVGPSSTYAKVTASMMSLPGTISREAIREELQRDQEG